MKGRVLNEDLYNEALQTIIRRDFFPDLAKINAHMALQEAQESGDPGRIQAAKCLIAQQDQDSSVVGNEEKSLDTKGVSLDAFVSTFTSEDNESFKQLFEKERHQKRLRNAWVFDENEGVKKNLLKMAGPKAVEEYEKEQEITRKQIEEHKLLMLPPPCREKSETAEETARCYKPTEINHSGTSLQGKLEHSRKNLTEAVTKDLGATQFEMMNGDLAMLAQRKLMKNEMTYNLDDYNATPQSQAAPGTPQVNGYKFVGTPSQSPGAGDASPFVTWGSVSTPLVLAMDPQDYVKGPHFEMAKESKRESTAKELANDVARRIRTEKLSLYSHKLQSMRRTSSTRHSSTPSSLRHTPLSLLRTPKDTPTPHSRDLTPAAQKLAMRFGKGREALFGGTPKRRKLGHSTPSLGGTPRQQETTPTPTRRPSSSTIHQKRWKRSSKVNSSITDDLLDIK